MIDDLFNILCSYVLIFMCSYVLAYFCSFVFKLLWLFNVLSFHSMLSFIVLLLLKRGA